MNGDISTIDAKAQGLAGHDVYRFSHLIYHSDINRDCLGILHLSREAFKAFNDSVFIGERHAVAAESVLDQQWIARGGFDIEPPPHAPTIFKTLKFLELDNLKIASGFELILKSILIENDFIVQDIENRPPYKDLSKEQKDRPIHSSKLFAIDKYRFNGELNYPPGLTSRSINFDSLINRPKYRAVLGVPHGDLDLIDEYRNLRNQIHLPGDPVETPVRASYPRPIIDFFIDFINKWVVRRGNALIQKHGLGGPTFTPLT